MRSDDALETFKRHADYEVGTTHDDTLYCGYNDDAMPVLIRRHVHVKNFVQVANKC